MIAFDQIALGHTDVTIAGGMESMKYLVGMIAGARAQADGATQVGYIAPFPIPEVIRHINAAALLMLTTGYRSYAG